MTMTTLSNTPTAKRPSWGILNAQTCLAYKMLWHGYSIREITVTFKGEAETKIDNHGRSMYETFTKTRNIRFRHRCHDLDRLADFAQEVSVDYFQMIGNFRQTFHTLQLTYELQITGKKNHRKSKSRKFEYARKMQGFLALYNWDRVMGNLPDSRLVEALTDSSWKIKRIHRKNLWLRALDLA